MKHSKVFIAMASFSILILSCILVAAAERFKGTYGAQEKGGGTVIELRDGKFRYWAWTDVINSDHPKYPITGRYSINGDRVVLKLKSPDFFIYRKINGHEFLIDEEGIKTWDKKSQRVGRFLMGFRTKSLDTLWESCPRGQDIENALTSK